MTLSRADVEHVASLARLGLSSEEVDTLREELSSILGHIAVLDRLDTSAIPPTAQVIALTNVLREDDVQASLPPQAVLANATRQEDGFFEVGAVFGVSDPGATP
jgi:aspartyl-tRNA(Asn)/glutamyl-tRNA(Gln) amidotransferase subunit C